MKSGWRSRGRQWRSRSLAAGRASHADYLAAEHYLNGVARLLVNSEAAVLDNLSILADDVRSLLDRMPPETIELAFIPFPYP